MKLMLATCVNYAKEYLVSFNPSKTLCLKFGSKRRDKEDLFLDNTPIKWVGATRHLGNMISSTGDYDAEDCRLKIRHFNIAVNKLQGNYAGLNSATMSELFVSYCSSFYGSQLWKLGSASAKSVCVQWNKGVRRILKLPHNTHRWLLAPLVGQVDHISVQFERCFLKFFGSMLNSENAIVAYCGRISSIPNSRMGANRAYIREKYGAESVCSVCDADRDAIVRVAIECRELLQSELMIYGMELDVIQEIFHDLCTL
jgi:hypothetical protein